MLIFYKSTIVRRPPLYPWFVLVSRVIVLIAVVVVTIVVVGVLSRPKMTVLAWPIVVLVTRFHYVSKTRWLANVIIVLETIRWCRNLSTQGGHNCTVEQVVLTLMENVSAGMTNWAIQS